MNITEIKKLIEKVLSENGPLVQEKRKRSFVQDTDIFLNKIKSIKDKYFSTKASISKHSVKKGETLSKIAKRNGSRDRLYATRGGKKQSSIGVLQNKASKEAARG